jgi:succinate dehydrogenase / fumarate reductase, membrane anchor subunit
MTGMRTPLARVRGLGTAREGTGHFWLQRLTAVSNVPLMLFFIGLLVALNGADYATVRGALGNPFVALMLALAFLSVLNHMRLGMQVIIEDYVHDEKWKLAAIIANLFFAIAVAAVCVYSLLKLSFGV